MERTSQSRHFNLHWVEQPAEWLSALEATAPVESSIRWKWIASHHQLLTLAKRSRREIGLSVLWFIVQDEQQTSLLFGAVLPGERVALLPTETIKKPTGATSGNAGIKEFLFGKIKFHQIMGAKSDLEWFLDESLTEPTSTAGPLVVEHQTAWGKPLSTADGPSTGDYLLALRTECRRATEVDRPRVQRWARLFAIDTKSDPEATTLEAFEWLRRGRLVIFEEASAIGMAAISGEYNCARLGRIGRISLVFIDPNHRGRGHGHTMLRSIEEEMRLEKMNGIVLYSDHGNERIRNLYSDLGFKTHDDWLEVRT